ncbi:hypothetical protein JCGZ_15182 [Jatropha curcas]|uniref:Uncharacterized protein n=1 Tax=Jatropha curcas TaxID=180498 RepID=A0A067K6Y5_JATCU|nr:hypothetical protein JCGZ_15182 [Jatropha curcas]
MKWRSIPLAILGTIPVFPRFDRTSSGANMALVTQQQLRRRSNDSGDEKLLGELQSIPPSCVNVFHPINDSLSGRNRKHHDRRQGRDCRACSGQTSH